MVETRRESCDGATDRGDGQTPLEDIPILRHLPVSKLNSKKVVNWTI